jgi:hypothetical protein
MNTVKKIATDVVTAGAAVSAVLAVVLNLAPSVHLPAQYVGYIVAASAIVAAVVAQVRRYAVAKVAAAKAAGK